MKKITLKEAMNLISAASAIIVDDDVLLYPSVENEPSGNPEEVFLWLKWEIDGEEYMAQFKEGDNQEITVVGSSMFLTESDENVAQVTLLTPQNVERDIDIKQEIV